MNNEKGNIIVRIQRKRTTSDIVISVWNDGPNIPATIVDKIFEEGFSSKGNGRGMGLSIIKKLCSQFNAVVTLDQFEGVKFKIVLQDSGDN